MRGLDISLERVLGTGEHKIGDQLEHAAGYVVVVLRVGLFDFEHRLGLRRHA